MKIRHGGEPNREINERGMPANLLYMSYKDEEDMFNIGINKYFDEGTEQYNQYKKDLSILKRKLIYPKFKLQHFVSSIDKYKFL